MKKSIKSMLNSQNVEFFMEAHNGIAAKIVMESGFNGIWASGLAISASCGVRDCNELSWTQILEILNHMSDSVDIPILMDGDTGFGDFNNFQRLVKKLEQINIGGVCIEDKVFPKKNSFLNNTKDQLEAIQTFSNKIKAGKDASSVDDFVIIARTEAFVLGFNAEIVIERADAYCNAGADAILVHSKASDIQEIQKFMNMWDNKKPVVIIPTTYGNISPKIWEDLGVSMVIWANLNIRASIYAMQRVSKFIHDNKSLDGVEGIISVEEIFRLTNVQDLLEAEKKYDK